MCSDCALKSLLEVKFLNLNSDNCKKIESMTVHCLSMAGGWGISPSGALGGAED